MKHWRLWLGGIAIVTVLGGLYLADFYVTRWVHYKMSYESLVKEEVRSMVKPSCLVE